MWTAYRDATIHGQSYVLDPTVSDADLTKLGSGRRASGACFLPAYFVRANDASADFALCWPVATMLTCLGANACGFPGCAPLA
jgi:hypothetical protein